jgi:hypothetical protein
LNIGFKLPRRERIEFDRMLAVIVIWVAVFLSHRVFVIAAAGLGPTAWFEVIIALAADSGLALLLSGILARLSHGLRVGIYALLGSFLVFTYGFARI